EAVVVIQLQLHGEMRRLLMTAWDATHGGIMRMLRWPTSRICGNISACLGSLASCVCSARRRFRCTHGTEPHGLLRWSVCHVMHLDSIWIYRRGLAVARRSNVTPSNKHAARAAGSTRCSRQLTTVLLPSAADGHRRGQGVVGPVRIIR